MPKSEKPLNETEKRVMLHALGEPIDRPPAEGKPYRNYYFDTRENSVWEQLVNRGLAVKQTVAQALGGGVYYHCTRPGILLATEGKYSEELQ